VNALLTPPIASHPPPDGRLHAHQRCQRAPVAAQLRHAPPRRLQNHRSVPAALLLLLLLLPPLMPPLLLVPEAKREAHMLFN
jgi:hypothetical protein